MSTSLIDQSESERPGPKGKAVGFLDSMTSVASLQESLAAIGVEETRMEVFHGAAGVQAWEEMMGASTWGEQAENFLNQGYAVLEQGGVVFAVRVNDREEAEQIAELATPLGARSVTHFGELVDTALTA